MVALKHDPLVEKAFEIQRKATNPQTHVWVSASAGTGKTKVLTDRILTLLLKGVNPRKILCLTFTKAAASEMMQRLLERLGQWAACGDFALKRELHLLMDDDPSPEYQKRARTLFVDILEAPGGFRIQTIHGFCQSLLSSFPLEANVSPEMMVMTEREQEEILAHAQEAALGSAQHNVLLKQAVAVLAEQFHFETFKEICEAFLQERLKLELILSAGLEAALEAARRILELDRDEIFFSPLTLFQKTWEEDRAYSETLKNLASLLLTGTDTDKNRARGILAWLERPKTEETFTMYGSHFLTEKGEIRKKLVTQGVKNAFPEVENLLFIEARKVQEVSSFLKKIKIYKVSSALLTVSENFLTHYENLKKERQMMDYDDLILKTQTLLHQGEFAPWVLYKLDGGIDHLLVDEAQDTNSLQWSIITALTEEFFAGKGAQDQSRTLFAVGDGKQSIYSFQGTDPHIFTTMRRYFSKRLSDYKEIWKDLEMSLSFRSVSSILGFVDTLFATDSVCTGVHEEENPLQHLCFRKGQAGHVELWPLVTSNPDTETSPSARTLLAYKVADQIEAWLSKKIPLVSRGRPLKAGDIMVLVRTRTEFVPALIQALKSKGIPVGGLDRLNLLEELAIQDLVALSEFLLLPENDFALACVLKSPFGGLNEEQLFLLSTTRETKSLWQNLKDHSSAFPELVTILTDLLKKVDFISPFTLYSDILFIHKGLQKIIARFGHEAMDPLEELLSLAYRYHHQFPASLQGFLQWLRQGRLEIKRDFSQTGSGDVRIMTVHGAKGLQAPVVILADTVSKPTLKQHFLWTEGVQPTCLWSPSQSLDIRVTQDLKQSAKKLQEQEYRRLLYVALTRAEDHLYICGADESQRDMTGSWYQWVESALSQQGKKILLPWGEGLRLENPQEIPPALIDTNPSEEDRKESETIPSWLFTAAEHEESFAKTAVTEESQISEKDVSAPCILKGRLIHQLLEILPALSSDRQRQQIEIYKHEWQEALEIFEDAVRIVQSILTDKNFYGLFQNNSRAEAPIMGYHEGKLYTARLDRVIVFENEVWIIDYKTDAKPAVHPDHIDARYKNQLQIYKALMRQIYPQHFIKTMILWTETRHLMEV